MFVKYQVSGCPLHLARCQGRRSFAVISLYIGFTNVPFLKLTKSHRCSSEVSEIMQFNWHDFSVLLPKFVCVCNLPAFFQKCAAIISYTQGLSNGMHKVVIDPPPPYLHIFMRVMTLLMSLSLSRVLDTDLWFTTVLKSSANNITNNACSDSYCIKEGIYFKKKTFIYKITFCQSNQMWSFIVRSKSFQIVSYLFRCLLRIRKETFQLVIKQVAVQQR